MSTQSGDNRFEHLIVTVASVQRLTAVTVARQDCAARKTC
jgi:hypothetical protein